MSKEQTETEKAKSWFFKTYPTYKSHVEVFKRYFPDRGYYNDDMILHIYQETQSEKGCPFDEEAFNPELSIEANEAIKTFEVFTDGFSQIVQARNVFNAGSIFELQNPKERILAINDVDFNKEPCNQFPDKKESVEEAAIQWNKTSEKPLVDWNEDHTRWVQSNHCPSGVFLAGLYVGSKDSGYRFECYKVILTENGLREVADDDNFDTGWEVDDFEYWMLIPEPKECQSSQLQSKISQLEADKKELVEALRISEEVSQNFYNTIVMIERKREVGIKERKEYCVRSKENFKSLIQKHTK